MFKIILKNYLSPGDIVMLTAAVRDLQASYPGEFMIDVRTSCPDLWLNNPYITPISDDDPDATTIWCQYPLIHTSNTAPFHFIHGFPHFLSHCIGKPLQALLFKGDIHLSAEEKRAPSFVEKMTGHDLPFWLIVSGGKSDFTTKWWDPDRYQEVIDHFKGQLCFVQVGEQNHFHPPLRHVVDLRGKTKIRELIRLMYHAEGVVCPITFLMHLAAAVETKPQGPRNRACVVIAGGREPSHWEAYPSHQYLHTIGALSCCSNGGCWKARTIPLNDGDEKDSPSNLCSFPVSLGGGKAANTTIAKCMDMIDSRSVIQKIELYLSGNCFSRLTKVQSLALSAIVSR